MIIALILSVALLLLGKLGIHTGIRELVSGIDFNQTLMVGMLSFLLFAGALHVDLNDLFKHKVEIGIFATLGVICSTLLIGSALYFILKGLSFPVPYLYCLLFGALISPTDPIAVLGILKQTKAPKDLGIKIAGESLFNDGVGVVIFITLLGLTTGQYEFSAGRVIFLFIKEVAGGIILGLLLGWLAYQMLRRIDQYQAEVLITLALVTGGYALSLAWHISGPIAIVVAGLFIGNHGKQFAMSERTVDHLDTFWELVDEILNAVLFVLIGLELLTVTLKTGFLLIGLIAVPLVLLARFISIGTPVQLLGLVRTYSPNTVKILTWGGLRGGISIALALSLPQGPFRELLLTVTYAVVVFSIVGQGLTIKYLIKDS
jgi:CPA1 family monovalent cation:H+ antiporter